MTPLLPAQTLSGLDRIHHMEFMRMCLSMPDASVDMILCDLPYFTTQNEWDALIPFVPMWQAFRRVLRDGGVAALTASQPFTSQLVFSNRDAFRYEWIWVKSHGNGFLDANRKPLKRHESVLIFADTAAPYFPQMTKGEPYRTKTKSKTSSMGAFELVETVNDGWRYPTSVLEFDNDIGLHPTQKPVALFEYLIRTYTQEGDLVFDPTTGSGTTAVAARNTKRRYVCGDKELDYVLIARDRLRLPFEKRHTPVNDDVSGLPLFAMSEA